MRVRDVMTPNPITVGSHESLRMAQERMVTHRCRRLPVLNEQDVLVGILTDRDVRLAVNSPLILRERWQDEQLLAQTQVAACMTPDPICVKPDTLLRDALDILLDHRISGLPVVDGDQLVGVLTVTDLLRALQQLLSTTT
jgi:acetoin utilization protein AcuB